MNVVIAAGGTGGHLYPAVALAEAFREQDENAVITFVGAGRSLEEAILSHGGFNMEPIEAQGIVGRRGWASLQALCLIPRAILKARRILREGHADLVIGTGGYVSPPVVMAAGLLGIPRAILEPNAMPGLANRVLNPVANRVFLAFEDAKNYFNPSKIRVVGTPVRKEFLVPGPPPSGQLRTLLVFGGSQGARAINSAMLEAIQISRILREDVHIIHQTGEQDHERMQAAYAEAGVQAEVVPFLFDMARALRSADLVVARSGAGTLAELAACGKAAILIPYPHATHQHQEKNSREVEAAGAAMVLAESELNGHRLVSEIETFVQQPTRLRTMAEKSLSRRKTDATEMMVQDCLQLLGAS